MIAYIFPTIHGYAVFEEPTTASPVTCVSSPTSQLENNSTETGEATMFSGDQVALFELTNYSVL